MRRRTVTVWASVLLIAAGLGSGVLLRSVDEVRTRATLTDVIYISSPKLLKRLSIGYDGLLADIYWTRAVQYYGGKHAGGGGSFDLLWPLLNITTQLDPHLLPAYEFGGTFLTMPPPNGAGLPERATELVESGVRNNPDNWHLYYDLGYLYYDLKDYPKAADAFERGSHAPNAHPFLKILAAQAAQHGGEAQTAQMLWSSVYQTSHDKYIRSNAIWHLKALQADQDCADLEKLVSVYRDKTGHSPESFRDLARAGMLRGVPTDPRGNEYQLDGEGHVFVADPENFPFIQKAVPPGYVPSSSPHIPASE
jgi:tetratricopeptide (TPR) repeat protein